jgi:glutamate dehydrogenase
MSADAFVANWVEALTVALGGDAESAERFASRVPAGYQQQVDPVQAGSDSRNLDALDNAPDGPYGPQRFAISTSSRGEGREAELRLRRYGRGGVELSSFLPIVESFGLVVVEAVPMTIAPGSAGEPAGHIDDFSLRLARPFGVTSLAGSSGSPVLAGGEEGAAPTPAVDELIGARLVQALHAVCAGVADLDSLNRLVIAAGLDWPQVRLLRAYRRYRRQAGTPFSDAELDDALVAYPAVARSLVELVEVRFDPEFADEHTRAKAAESVRTTLLERLAGVAHFAQDQVLRGYLAMVDATVRTSYFLRAADGSVPPTVTLKLDSRSVPDLPLPRPEVETWVHGSSVEGIHLRFGRIARGGLRWSERPDDFRTEVLDLAAAQVKKNAVIVPTGAKGGFVCRGGGSVTPEAVQSAYELFVSGLLDITDNLVDGRARPPAGVVAADGEDPYLVVAADKGTATFSDVANRLAIERGFWLGDAFASGGSHGYDHKAMGITAKGAWVAVRRHFHQLGVDVQHETIRVAGVGDMSGDVFGNGLLQSRAVALVAAFDHRHIFLDPDPDPEVAYAERARLFALARSSWDDYDRRCISPGGGVWPRDAKAIPLAPAVRRVLGVDAEELSPPEVISAILASQVDLLWFGGIGTFVRAPGETDADVGDHANDAVRVTADQVRARVVAEGGNLAVTQRARIRYSRRGGRINTDFIDNAAGVATSDREVNIKILVDLAIRRGRLDPERRDALLAECEDAVAGEVLRQVDHAVAALNRAVPASAHELDAYEALIVELERAGLLDREVEDLPGAEELARRREAGAGLIRPELAVVQAYAKSDLSSALERSSTVEDPTLLDAVSPYFPPAVRDAFGDLVPEHRLYRQLVATDLAGEIVDQLGPVWARETAAELGIDVATVAGAFWAARQVLDAGELLARIEESGALLSADVDAALHAVVTGSLARLARRYLLTGRSVPAEVIPPDRDLAERIRAARPGSPPVPAALTGLAVPPELAAGVADRAGLVDLADAQSVAAASGADPVVADLALAAFDTAAGTGRIATAVEGIAPSGRWPIWQVRSVLDDLAAWRCQATAAALAGLDDPAGVTPAGASAAVESWVSARAERFGRLWDLLDLLQRLLAEGSGAGRGVADLVALASALARRLPR